MKNMSEQDVSAVHLDNAGEPIKEGKPSQEPRKRLSRLEAGDVSLDFVNTLHPDGYLTNAADLIRWSRDVGVITEEGTQTLLEEIEANPGESSAVFMQAMALREASYCVLLALIHQASPAAPSVHVLQAMFQQARAHGELAPTGDHLAWQWEPAEAGLAQLYWLFSRSTETLLTSATMERVKECPPAQGGCGWLFLDRSKNSSRQWCSDETCGSKIRMRRLYARKRVKKER
jgi:predicted RNA-binding Zn ribbon-like protein